MADDPYVLLAAKIHVDPVVLRSRLQELGLSLNNDAAHIEWERRMRLGGTERSDAA